MNFNIGIRIQAISVQANLRIVGARFTSQRFLYPLGIGRMVLKEIAQQAALLHTGAEVIYG